MISGLIKHWHKQANQRPSNGAQAEDYACQQLTQAGHKILQRNYRSRRGEIDIITQSSDSLVFVEVKLRTNSQYGQAVEMVSRHKQRRIIAAAKHFLANHEHFSNHPCRFDVFALQYDQSGHLQVDWLKNAFTTDG